MSEIIKPSPLEQQINCLNLAAAFGSIDYAQNWINQITDKKSYRLLLMHGSFVNKGKQPDLDYRSDIDLVLIDYFLFRSLPRSQIMTKSQKIPQLLLGHMSLPLTLPNGEVKHYLTKGKFKNLYYLIKDCQLKSARIIDINIYRTLDHWLLQQLFYWDLGKLKFQNF